MSVTLTPPATRPLSIPEAMEAAQRMHAGGWPIDSIRMYLARRGVTRGWRTVKRWADPEYAAADREETRARERLRWATARGARLGRRDQTPEFKLARIRALRARGASLDSIAVVMAFDYGDEHLTGDKVRWAL